MEILRIYVDGKLIKTLTINEKTCKKVLESSVIPALIGHNVSYTYTRTKE